jgi:hypothetical protein
MSHAHLRRAEHMPRRMQRNFDTAMHDFFAIFQRLYLYCTEPRTHHTLRLGVCKVMPVASACMVGMCVGDDRAVHRPPRVDIKISCRAIQTLRALHDQVHGRSSFINSAAL